MSNRPVNERHSNRPWLYSVEFLISWHNSDYPEALYFIRTEVWVMDKFFCSCTLILLIHCEIYKISTLQYVKSQTKHPYRIGALWKLIIVPNVELSLICICSCFIDTELHKFKCELEADNKGITEVLEKRSLDLDINTNHTSSTNNNHYKESRLAMCCAFIFVVILGGN